MLGGGFYRSQKAANKCFQLQQGEIQAPDGFRRYLMLTLNHFGPC